MKLLHTADWQIGMRAAHIGARAADVRAVRFESAERVVRIARERGADAVLVTGDTFEDNNVASADVQRVTDILAGFGGPVYVISGNHDPMVVASLWKHPGWQRPNLHLLLEPTPIAAAPGVTLYPCPLAGKTSRLDPTAWIAGAGGDGLRIGLAHGTVMGATVAEDVFPIPRDAADRLGLDYLALGHWHSTASFDGELESTRMAYAGSHEATKFGERDSGNALLVEVRGRGATPIVERIATGTLAWRDVMCAVVTDDDLDALFRDVDAIADPAHTLLKVRLTGVLRPSALEKVAHLRDVLTARFPLLGTLDDSGLLPAPNDGAEWIGGLPAGLARGVAESLTANPQPDDAEAQRTALMQLFRFTRELEGAAG